MGKIAKDVNKVNVAILYGNYCDIIIENLPQKFSPCITCSAEKLFYVNITHDDVERTIAVSARVFFFCMMFLHDS